MGTVTTKTIAVTLALLCGAAEAAALSPLPPPPPIVIYGTRVTPHTPKLPKFGPVELGDAFALGSFDVRRSDRLGLPADALEPGHRKGYRIRPAPGGAPFAPISGVRVVDGCGELFLQLKRPERLFLPAAKSLSGLPGPPPSGLDHLACYRAKVERKRPDGSPAPGLPRARQIELTDQFQDRRYDLLGLTRFCTPTSKTGFPVILSGRARGVPFPIAPAFPEQPGIHWACYRARLAKTTIEQTGCGPAAPNDRGTPIDPPQPAHVPRRSVHLQDQFGLEQVDTSGEIEVCLPVSKDPSCGNGVLDSLVGETCDDGNTTAGDGCSASCQLEFCGDAIVQPALGEECEGSSDDACPGECRSDCLCPRPCAHGPCEVGAPLDRLCDPCVTTVCAIDPYCCNVFWDGICVDEADRFCPGLSCTPYGSPSRAFLRTPSCLTD